MWSAIAARKARSWLMTTTVASSSRRYCSSQAVVSRSRWLVGSSRSRTSPGAASCRARPMRPRSPPLSCDSGWVRAFSGSKPSPWSTASTLGAISYPPSRSNRSRSREYLAIACSEASVPSASAWRASDCSRARRSLKGPAAAAHTVSAPSKVRCCSSSVTLMPLTRATLPVLGARSPVRMRKSVVLPMPFRPTIPHRSPRAMVKVMFLNSVVAPNSTPALERAIRLMPGPGSSGAPPLPLVLRSTHGELVRVSYQGHAQQQRLERELLEPPVVGEARVRQPELHIAPRRLVDQRVESELLDEAPQLAGGRRTFHQVHEVDLDPPFGEESLRLPGLRALLHPEDLDLHMRPKPNRAAVVRGVPMVRRVWIPGTAPFICTFSGTMRRSRAGARIPPSPRASRCRHFACSPPPGRCSSPPVAPAVPPPRRRRRRRPSIRTPATWRTRRRHEPRSRSRGRAPSRPAHRPRRSASTSLPAMASG